MISCIPDLSSVSVHGMKETGDFGGSLELDAVLLREQGGHFSSV